MSLLKLSVGCVRWNDTCRYFKNVRYAFLPELFVALRHWPSVREVYLRASQKWRKISFHIMNIFHFFSTPPPPHCIHLPCWDVSTWQVYAMSYNYMYVFKNVRSQIPRVRDKSVNFLWGNGSQVSLYLSKGWNVIIIKTMSFIILRQMHYPPETSSIMLIARMIATIKQVNHTRDE